MVPIFQGTAADCPEIPFPADADLVQVLWCGSFHGNGEFGLRSFWRRSSDCDRVFSPDPLPPSLESFGQAARLSSVTEVVDFPMFRSLPDGVVSDLERAWPMFEILRNYKVQSGMKHNAEDLSAIYNDTLGAVPGMKIAGWPRWVEDEDKVPTCAKGHRMDLMLTLDSECWSRGADYWTARVAGAGLSAMHFIGLFCCATCPERPLREASSCT